MSKLQLNNEVFYKEKWIVYSFIMFVGAALIFISVPNFMLSSVYSQTSTNNSGVDLTNSSTEFLTYQDPEGKYKIDYPSDWVPDQQMSGVFYLSNLTSSISLQLFSGLDSSRTFDQVVKYYKDLHINDNMTEAEAFEFKGNPAYKMVYEDMSGSKIMEVRTRTQTPDDFTFTYSASAKFHDEYLPTVQKMIDSFNEVQSNASSTSNP